MSKLKNDPMGALILINGLLNNVAENSKVPQNAKFVTLGTLISKVIEFSLGETYYNDYLQNNAQELKPLWNAFDEYMQGENVRVAATSAKSESKSTKSTATRKSTARGSKPTKRKPKK